MVELSKNWDDELAEVVESYWGDQREPLLFSKVPFLLKERGIDFKEISNGVSLKNAVLLAQNERIRAIQNPDDTKIWAIVPSSEVSSATELFGKLRRASAPRTKDSARIDRSIWAAIAKPLTNDKRYVFRDGEHYRFRDVADGDAIEESWLNVPNRLIGIDGQTLDNEDILERVYKWADSHSIPHSELAINTDGESAGGLAVFARLSEEDQKRIALPMDIVLKMLNV